jgi:hypothetical protein
MAERLISFNPAQLTAFILQGRNKVEIHGRGTGKSHGMGWTMHLNNRFMPRSVTSITGQTFGQLMTRTLPSTFKFLEETLGYVRNVHYVINRQPPDHFKRPYERILKYDHFISFLNGTGYLMASQDRPGSGRGPNLDFEIIDEALTIIKDRYDQEISPANRGNLSIFGPRSDNPIPWHHGFHYVSSMPATNAGKWLLEFGNYYEEEAGIRYFDIWNKVVKMQIDLLEIENPAEFKSLWNEIVRIRKQILPFVSSNGTLFTLSNAFDNIQNVGLSYIKREYEKQTMLTFLIEIMNMVLDKVEDCYYNIDESRQIYFNSYNNDFIRDLAEDSDWDFQRLGTPDSRFDKDCNPNAALELVFDWGSRISLMSVGQEQKIDFNTLEMIPTDNFINEFYVKPGDNTTVMIDDLIDLFCNYYRFHNDKTVIYYRDKYGDHKQANSAKTYNEQAIDRLANNGWVVIPQEHRGQEPPHHDKYLLWGNILKENNPKFPRARFNGNKCKYTIISMNNTRVIEKDGRFKKDKRSEDPKSGVLPEEATHFGDACDKKIWIKYGDRLHRFSSFVPARFGQ